MRIDPDPPVPPGVDPEVASVARVYDYYLGGRNNFASDRRAGDQLEQVLPELKQVAWANRGFHQRAAKWMTEQGIRQFIDIGSGLPTMRNTHEVVRAVDDHARVVYADKDPQVAAFAPQLLTDGGWTSFIQADLRDPGAILGHPELRRLVKPGLPTGLLMTAVWQFIGDGETPSPWELMQQYISWLPPGSYAAVSHVTGDKKPPVALDMCRRIYAEQAKEPIYPRTLAEVTRFFDGAQIVPPFGGAEPQVVHAGLWGAENPRAAGDDGSSWMYAGVGYVS
jgi:S-adenosyl methyltransferase